MEGWAEQGRGLPRPGGRRDAKEAVAKAGPADKAAATAHYEERAAHASEFKEARANNDKEAATAMTYYEKLTKKLNMWTRADKP